jgi:hypothetical protein
MKLMRIGQSACQQILRRTLEKPRTGTRCRPHPRARRLVQSASRNRLTPPCPLPCPTLHLLNPANRPFRLGIGGPVGSGKTMCVLRLCQWLKDEISLAVITNDIYTREDAEFLLRENVLPADRVRGVETGGCPHTAIRDDTSMNMAAVVDLENAHPDLNSSSSKAAATIYQPPSRPNSSMPTSMSSTWPRATRSRARAARPSAPAICCSSTRPSSPLRRRGPGSDGPRFKTTARRTPIPLRRSQIRKGQGRSSRMA